MKIIDGEVYVNKEDAMKAMEKELDTFGKKDVGGEMELVIGLTIFSFMTTLFGGEEKDG